MKTQILPNWFKKIGLILFIVGSIIGGGDDMVEGFKDGYNESRYGISEKQPQNNNGLITMFVGGENTTHIFYVLSFIGMLIYMLSKEKIEDDYINKLRLESFQLTSIITLIIGIVLLAFSKISDVSLDLFISLFFWFYLITFFIKKRIDL
ncbi:MAG: hypothetical protein J7K34_09655 [Flavobacteriaceae bacterium]|nr:hypothetical protein [Flavobacteriaceae bacterium]